MKTIESGAQLLAEANGIDWTLLTTDDNGHVTEQDVVDYLMRVMMGDEAPPETPVDLPPEGWDGTDPHLQLDTDMLSRAGVEADLVEQVQDAGREGLAAEKAAAERLASAPRAEVRPAPASVPPAPVVPAPVVPAPIPAPIPAPAPGPIPAPIPAPAPAAPAPVATPTSAPVAAPSAAPQAAPTPPQAEVGAVAASTPEKAPSAWERFVAWWRGLFGG